MKSWLSGALLGFAVTLGRLTRLIHWGRISVIAALAVAAAVFFARRG